MARKVRGKALPPIDGTPEDVVGAIFGASTSNVGKGSTEVPITGEQSSVKMPKGSSDSTS